MKAILSGLALMVGAVIVGRGRSMLSGSPDEHKAVWRQDVVSAGIAMNKIARRSPRYKDEMDAVEDCQQMKDDYSEALYRWTRAAGQERWIKLTAGERHLRNKTQRASTRAHDNIVDKCWRSYGIGPGDGPYPLLPVDEPAARYDHPVRRRPETGEPIE